MDSSGRRVGHYRIEETLGSGGMGTVYRAWDEVLERWVAIKCIRGGKEHSEERRERLRREARAAAGLDHPAVARVFDLFEENGADYIVMELVEGRSLASALLDGPMDPRLAVSLARQIAEGLAAAHARGIVHRDLKAENIMLTSGGGVKILDFGLAKRLQAEEDSLTQDGIVMGTSRAMSPEQARGEEVDHRSDLFSLGSLLYEMLTGRHPFQAGSPLETMRRVVRHHPRPVTGLRPDLPEDLALLVEGLLEKDPGRRPQSAAEVALALEALEAFWATSTTDQTSLARLTAAARRRRLMRRWWIPAGIAVIVAAAGLYLAASRPPRPPTMVVVAPTETAAGAGEAAVRAAGLTRIALLQAVASARGLATPDPAALRGVTGTPAEIARAAGAHEALAASVEEHGPTFRVTVRRLDASGRLLWTDATTVPADSDETLVQAVHALAAQAFPGQVREGLGAPPEAFAQYAELAALDDNPPPGLTKADLLRRATELARRWPDLLEAHLLEARLARYLYQTGHDRTLLGRAQAAAERAVTLAPNDPRALGTAISVAQAAGETERAEALLERLETVAPGSPEALRRRAWMLRSRGDWKGALAVYQRLVRLYPSWIAFWNLANAHIHAGNPDRAREAIARGLERAPDNRYLLAQLAQLELVYGDLERAAALYHRLLAAYPSPVYASNLGLARMLEGKLAEAEAAFRRALELGPGDPTTLLNLADCLELQGQREAAREGYRRALERAEAAGGAGEALAVTAQCLAHLGRGAEAVAAVQELLRLQPDDPDALLAAAVSYAVAGERLSARAAIDQALDRGLAHRWLELPWLKDVVTKPAVPARPTASVPDRP